MVIRFGGLFLFGSLQDSNIHHHVIIIIIIVTVLNALPASALRDRTRPRLARGHGLSSSARSRPTFGRRTVHLTAQILKTHLGVIAPDVAAVVIAQVTVSGKQTSISQHNPGRCSFNICSWCLRRLNTQHLAIT